jgi:hypothetical protein
MFTHCVYFWLKEGLSPGEVAEFEKGLRSLTTISTVVHGFVGTPAATDRPIIDRSYSYGLVVAFRDEAGHDAYQVDPIHSAFRDGCAQYWRRVTIYDFQDAGAR